MGLKWAIGGIYVEPSFRSRHSATIKRGIGFKTYNYCSLKNLSLVICVSSLPVVTCFKHMHRPGGKFTSWICVVFILPSIFHDSGPENDLHVCAGKKHMKITTFYYTKKMRKAHSANVHSKSVSKEKKE